MKTQLQVKQASGEILKTLQMIKQHTSKLESSINEFSQSLQVIEGGKLKSTIVTETNVVKRGRGRPKKDSSLEQKNIIVKRKPGRPKKENQVDSSIFVKRKPGRPKKNENTIVATVKKNGRGRPSIKDVIDTPTHPLIDKEVLRIEEASHKFNKWGNYSNKEKVVFKIQNGTYLGIIEGFYSSGNSGRYGITTRLYINPDSHLVPEDLKQHIETAAVNRIRYVESKEEGLEYIEKQKAKIAQEFFSEILPRIIKDHGKKGSVYAFHLDKTVRRDFNKLKTIFDNKEMESPSKVKSS